MLISSKAQLFLVNNKSGNQSSLLISEIRSITFSANNLVFNKKDGNTESMLINNIKFISFDNLSTEITTPIKNTTKLNIYPNPVHNNLNIEFIAEDQNSIINIEVLSIDGRLIYSNRVNSGQSGNHSINTSTWMQGLYLLRVRNGNEITTNKIIKN